MFPGIHHHHKKTSFSIQSNMYTKSTYSPGYTITTRRHPSRPNAICTTIAHIQWDTQSPQENILLHPIQYVPQKHIFAGIHNHYKKTDQSNMYPNSTSNIAIEIHNHHKKTSFSIQSNMYPNSTYSPTYSPRYTITTRRHPSPSNPICTPIAHIRWDTQSPQEDILLHPFQYVPQLSIFAVIHSHQKKTSFSTQSNMYPNSTCSPGYTITTRKHPSPSNPISHIRRDTQSPQENILLHPIQYVPQKHIFAGIHNHYKKTSFSIQSNMYPNSTYSPRYTITIRRHPSLSNPICTPIAHIRLTKRRHPSPSNPICTPIAHVPRDTPSPQENILLHPIQYVPQKHIFAGIHNHYKKTSFSIQSNMYPNNTYSPGYTSTIRRHPSIHPIPIAHIHGIHNTTKKHPYSIQYGYTITIRKHPSPSINMYPKSTYSPGYTITIRRHPIFSIQSNTQSLQENTSPSIRYPKNTITIRRHPSPIQ
ncbi:unnamed protein product [Acanthosepion pharaonis]|uniref:Uncharacterized protein n=1 Tax=Acanthosepion pharaonis TaxID=158019 RepID=A0A812CUG6_ACAPH|nr:unnamed protein product [Sepia pharaonis]